MVRVRLFLFVHIFLKLDNRFVQTERYVAELKGVSTIKRETDKHIRQSWLDRSGRNNVRILRKRKETGGKNHCYKNDLEMFKMKSKQVIFNITELSNSKHRHK